MQVSQPCFQPCWRGQSLLIPEFQFNIDHLTELLSADRKNNPSRYSIVLVSEGAKFRRRDGFCRFRTDAYGHAKLGGIGDLVAAKIKEISPKFQRWANRGCC